MITRRTAKYCVRIVVLAVLAAFLGCANVATNNSVADKNPGVAVSDWREIEGMSASSWQVREQANLALLADDPNHPEAHSQLAEIYFKQFVNGKHNHFKQLARVHAEKALAAKPGDFAVSALYYKVLYTQVRLGDAAQFPSLKKYYQSLPEQYRNSFFPPSLALYLFESERLSPTRDKQQSAELKRILSQALKEQPRNALIHVQLSRFYFDANQIDVAFAMLQQAFRLEPENPQVILALADSYRTKAQRSGCVYDELDAIKRSVGFYKLLLGQPATEPSVHWGLMVNYAHLGLAPLSLREGEQVMGAQAPAANKWIWATFLTYQGQAARAQPLFEAARSQLPKAPSRALVEHYLLRGQWKQAGNAFVDYIGSVERPGVSDLLLASMIEVESQDKAISISSLWRTDKKAAFFSKFDEALAKYWRGEMEEAQFAQQVENSCQKSQFEFYVGYLNLLNNRVGKAREHFEKARAVQQPMHFEVQMASGFLHELLQSRKQPK